MRTPQHDKWILDAFGVRMPGATPPVAPSGAAPRTSKLDRLRAAGRELASGGGRALATLSQGKARATAEEWQGVASGGRALGAGLRHAGGDLVQGAAAAKHDVVDGARHGHLAAGLVRAKEHLDAKSGAAVGDAWHGLTGAVGKGAQGELNSVRAMGRANGQAFDRAVDGASAGVTRLAGARAGVAVRRDAQRLSQPVRFLANFGLGAGRGLGEAGGEIVKGTGDLAVGALRLSGDAQYRAKAGREARALWHAAEPLAADALHHPGHAAHRAGHAVKAAVNKTLDEGQAAQQDGSFAEWDGHFAFKLATNIATSIMPQTKAAKLAEAASLLRGGLKVEGMAAKAGEAARLADGAEAARAAGALRPGKAAASAHAMPNLPGEARATASSRGAQASGPNAYQRLVAERKAEAAERLAAGAPPRPAPGAGAAPPLTEHVAFKFAVMKDDQPGSWFEKNCKGLAGEDLLKKLESVKAKELEVKAPYCHAFLRASAVTRETGAEVDIDAGQVFQHLREPAAGFKALNSAGPGRATFPAQGVGPVEGQGRRVRYAAAKSITQVAGTATELDRKLVMNTIAKHVPAQVIEALKKKGVDIFAVRDSIVERLPQYRGQKMADYTSQTGEQTKGVYHHDEPDKVVVVASVPPKEGEAGVRRLPGRRGHSNVDIVMHEIGHAIDYNLHGATVNNRLSESRAFRNAVALDRPHIDEVYVAMGHSEIFGDYIARFMCKPEELRQSCPNLYTYFHKLVHQPLKN